MRSVAAGFVGTGDADGAAGALVGAEVADGFGDGEAGGMLLECAEEKADDAGFETRPVISGSEEDSYSLADADPEDAAEDSPLMLSDEAVVSLKPPVNPSINAPILPYTAETTKIDKITGKTMVTNLFFNGIL
ncbi:MAG: hypothetical protein ACYC5K_01995 [Saccharofermentanales bacterium]